MRLAWAELAVGAALVGSSLGLMSQSAPPMAGATAGAFPPALNRAAECVLGVLKTTPRRIQSKVGRFQRRWLEASLF